MARKRLATPSQTSGPMFAFALLAKDAARTVDPSEADAITIEGHVFDGNGEPVPFSDAFVEVWCGEQLARAPTDSFGVWRVTVRRPGPTALPDGRLQAPHMNVTVFARGLMKQAQTRVYFPDAVDANAVDPVLALVDPERRESLIARRRGDDGAYEFDVYLQGERETVFFDF